MAGCALPDQRASFDSDDPIERSLAASKAASVRDAQSVPELVAMLESADPAQRMVAIASLERITGQRMDYDPSAPEWERQKAVRGWITWLRGGGLAGEPHAGRAQAVSGPVGVGGSQPISP